MDKQIAYWIEESEKDLPVAEILLEKGHYTWCLFVGHLVLEKILKAIYVKEHRKLAPRIHDLVKLAKSTKLELTDDQLLFLSEVSDFSMEGRYPDEKSQFAAKCNEEFADGYLKKIREMHCWLKQQVEK
ncbi:MAG: HEPN domain-containing protein [Deltaproteobacteria bacterium]|nr:HEPN domain-containing protein [Deltaproteobacteria bacterium]